MERRGQAPGIGFTLDFDTQVVPDPLYIRLLLAKSPKDTLFDIYRVYKSWVVDGWTMCFEAFLEEIVAIVVTFPANHVICSPTSRYWHAAGRFQVIIMKNRIIFIPILEGWGLKCT